ncbi:hypothetical protein A4A49_31549 [Nicotiana attenuata]|uniref:DC1 domain-containing protein n=1 Tax=Nicotiana attenuata TaxID=49451 RepID=A0A314L9L0_NICAT|nr:hypothetical protein A4A49_31549 [Nicotiana attenuata]
MPQQITHPFDEEHQFILLPKPIYPDGNFNCDACGENGDGFSYHCKTCGTELHILCAIFPLCVTHWSHHHQLDLKLSPPYPDKSLCCDICKNVGTNHWLYRCQTCGFDAHLNCTKLQAPPHQTHIYHNPTTSRSAPQQQQHFTGINHMNQGINNGPAVPQFWSRQNNEMSAQEILRKQSEDQQNLIQEMFTAATARQNELIQQHMAATSRKNQDIYQQIMVASARQNQEINQQLTQALMNNASAGGVPMPNLYQNMMGGLNNGGGVNVLQAFSGGGGGGIGGGSGGMELLQSLMGGGSGAIGGLDLTALFGSVNF